MVLDRIHAPDGSRIRKAASKKRPVRDFLENNVDKIPRGPLGYAGKGNVTGAVTYFVTSTINGINPVSGVNLGFKVVTHTIDRHDSYEMHTITVDSWAKETARFTSKFEAPPSTVDYFRQKITIESLKPLTKRRTSTTWRAKVKVEDRNIPTPLKP